MAGMNNTAEFADTVLMVRPRRFGYNETTAGSNHFQYRMPDLVASEIQSRALREFEGLRDLLRDEGVDVIEFDDSEEPGKPDALFPNNWFSTDPNGTIILYPMEGENRRFERRTDIVDSLRHSHCYGRMIDLTAFERDGKFLEGTGSMVFDRRNSVIYAALSSRTDPVVLAEFASRSGFREIVTFHTDLIRTPEGSPQPIYHTNVVLAIGLSTAVICTGVISATEEKRGVVNSLTRGGRTVVEITVEQLLAFAGNMLQVRNKADHLLWVMSTSAFDSLSSAQKTILVSAGSRLIHSALPTIETVGGGSARCMLAEIFRPVPHEAREI
ncbi:MAG: arginine deiminase-related protein [Ignavibacteria bacterium]|nr:arginine deiminase-related protein [Ignavibacteria bacterium]